MTRIGDWVAMVTTVGSVLGCVIVGLIWIGMRVVKTIALFKGIRADEAPSAAPRAARIRLLPLLASAAAFVIAAWLAGDDLLTRAATSLPMGPGGWVELAVAAALCCSGVWLLLQVMSALRRRPSTPHSAAADRVRLLGIGGRSR